MNKKHRRTQNLAPFSVENQTAQGFGIRLNMKNIYERIRLEGLRRIEQDPELRARLEAGGEFDISVDYELIPGEQSLTITATFQETKKESNHELPAPTA